VHCHKFSKIKNTKSLITFLQCEIKNQNIKYDIFKINYGSSAENFSSIGTTFGALIIRNPKSITVEKARAWPVEPACRSSSMYNRQDHVGFTSMVHGET
jgi:hypothetical protein